MSFSECRKRLFDNLVSPLLLLNNILGVMIFKEVTPIEAPYGSAPI